MADEFEVAPEGVADEVVAEPIEQDTAEADDQGQELEAQPPEGEPEAAEPEGEKTESQKRRERRKAQMQSLREEAEAAQAQLARIRDAAKGDKEPRKDDFDDPDDYVAARAAYLGAQSFTQREERAAEAAAQEAARRLTAEQVAAWEEQRAEAKARYADFDAVVGNPDVPISQSLSRLITATENAADVAYSVASDPQLAARLSRMNPVEAALEVGRISARVAVPQPKTRTAAPAPINPVRGGGSPQPDPAKMSNAEYRAWRRNGGG